MTDTPSMTTLRGPLAWTATPGGKVVLILVLLLVLQVPLFMVSGLIEERQTRQSDVQNEFTRSWGPAQALTGPILAVPYYVPNADTRLANIAPQPRTRGWIQIPASQLSISAQLAPQTRSRGLFHAVVYNATTNLSGTIVIPQIRIPEVEATDLLWQEAIFVIGATDLRGLPFNSMAQFGGRKGKLTGQSAGASCGDLAVASAQLAAPPAPGSALAFNTQITVQGTRSYSVVPYGREIDMHVSAPWRTPGFTGRTLPLTWESDHQGFHAHWQVAGDALFEGWRVSNTSYPLCVSVEAANPSQFGVDLLEAVPKYLMVERASKYGTLFLAFSFMTYFGFEAIGGARIHIAQYGLLGLSVSLFALLLVALAEPLGFLMGYVLSTVAVMAQASIYTYSVMGLLRRAVLFACILGILFGFLYVLLSLESLSLLIGTLALFAGLSLIMAVTRQLDWTDWTMTRSATNQTSQSM